MGQRKKINKIKGIARKAQLLGIAKARIVRAGKSATAGQKLHAAMHGRSAK